MNAEPQKSGYFRGMTGLIAVLAVIATLVLWHRFKPLKEEDVNNKRPLGLE